MTMYVESVTAFQKGITTPTAKKQLNESDQFMQLLLTELRNQNPLEPMKDKEFIGQMAQINSLQEMRKMNTSLQEIFKNNRLTQAAGLIGKEADVNILDAYGESQTLTALVTGVTLQDDEVMLLMGTQQASLADLLSVREREATA